MGILPWHVVPLGRNGPLRKKKTSTSNHRRDVESSVQEKRLYWRDLEEKVTLPKFNIAPGSDQQNSPFWWNLQGNIGIFMGYVSLQEGKGFLPPGNSAGDLFGMVSSRDPWKGESWPPTKRIKRSRIESPGINIAPEKWWLEEYFPFGMA